MPQSERLNKRKARARGKQVCRKPPLAKMSQATSTPASAEAVGVVSPLRSADAGEVEAGAAEGESGEEGNEEAVAEIDWASAANLLNWV